MLHGPCGVMNDRSPCMKDGRCSKDFPKEYADFTVVNDDGSVVYRRRHSHIISEKNGIIFTNAHVVPYNVDLLIKYQAHLNVEKCYSPELIKYLFKYICKGPDRQYISVDTKSDPSNVASSGQQSVVNEVKDYLDCRCITPPEAIWRLYQYDIHQSHPSVERLPVHLPGENTIMFNDFDRLDFIANNENLKRTKLTEWFTLNRRDPNARRLKYCQIPEEYVWNSKHKMWTLRIQRTRLGRMYYVHPSLGELYYLRLLLAEICGATSFESLRTINGVVYRTFQEACKVACLIDDSSEWIHAINDAATWSTSYQLRKLFIYILIHSEPADSLDLWENTWRLLCDDIEHRFKKENANSSVEITDEMKKNYVLECLQKDLELAGRSLQAYNLPLPTFGFASRMDNRLMREQMSFNRPELLADSIRMKNSLNSDQLRVYNVVMDSIDNNAGKFFFVQGYGGTGKTFLWQSIIAHSRFKIPSDKPNITSCDIKLGTNLAELIQNTSLIIWDEAPMNHRQCFEALDITLRDIMGAINNTCRYKLFGGITVLLGGDFRQTLPIVPAGTRNDTVNSCILNSPLWLHCQVLTLTINMRLLHDDMSSDERNEAECYSKWLTGVGDGTIPGKKLYNSSDSDWIEIPSSLLLSNSSNNYSTIVHAVYPDLQLKYKDIEYLCERAIVTPTNVAADNVNAVVAELIPGEAYSYFSCDTIQDEKRMSKKLRDMYPPEYLNLLTPNGVPNHHIPLKIGIPIMLLRNIDQSAGLCNGTRLVVVRLSTHCIEAEIITGHAKGTRTLIPRIIFIKKEVKWPFTLRRKQFPIRICYAMTINKSQGQTLANIGIYLPNPVFSHGQLYVALSRAKDKNGVKILIVNPDGSNNSFTRNIVYREIFTRLGIAT
ncbi:ATP-dependent DNA helicase PIF1 [Rhynchospora pubera]|uniref:ATP-dependent DNA helicase n=1 Tax=Rhynchospora pubera TaxID=906938 RepID=A0AAV8H398_9POAL|nr:ATP-dependent DNA helicase PIF1 [Rhynchospora pubera]